MPDPCVGCFRVVIVDDATHVRELLRRLPAVDRRIDIVGEAADGAEAVDVIDALDPDAVLLDVRMPGMDGVATLRHLKRERRTPVVMYSADSGRKGEALAAGADAWVDKDEGLNAIAAALTAFMTSEDPSERDPARIGPRAG